MFYERHRAGGFANDIMWWRGSIFSDLKAFFVIQITDRAVRFLHFLVNVEKFSHT